MNESHGRQSRSAMRLAVAALAALVAVGVVTLTAPAPAGHAAPADAAIQVVGVDLGWDATVNGVTSVTAVRDTAGKVTDEEAVLDPAQVADDLPARVTTAYWLGDETGTDLEAVRGRAGRVTVEVTIQDLSAEAQEVSFEADGAKYRQTSLVGVPLTVVAAVDLGLTKDTIVFDPLADDAATGADRVTNGSVTRTATGAWTVQWATLLAPPLLPPTATFRLVVDTASFTPPTINVSVQPGLHLDPSIRDALATALGSEGDMAKLQATTIDLIEAIDDQTNRAGDFIEAVHEALTEDVEQLGAQTYEELKASSEAILSQLESTEDTLASLRDSITSGIQSAQSDLASQLKSLLDNLETNVLGSRPQAKDFVATTVTGCSIALPQFVDPAAPDTIARTVGLVDKQLEALIAAFDVQSEADRADNPNCRHVLAQEFAEDLGDPVTPCTTETEGTVFCRIEAVRSGPSGVQASIDRARTEALDLPTTSRLVDLIDAIQALDPEFQSLTLSLQTIRTQLDTARDSGVLDPLVDPDGTPPDGLRQRLDRVRAQIADIRSEYQAIMTASTGPLARIADARTDIDASLVDLVGTLTAAADQATTFGAIQNRLQGSSLVAYIDALKPGCGVDAEIGRATDLADLDARLKTLAKRPSCDSDQRQLVDAVRGLAAQIATDINIVKASVDPTAPGDVETALSAIAAGATAIGSSTTPQSALHDLNASLTAIDTALSALDDLDPTTTTDLLDSMVVRIDDIEDAVANGAFDDASATLDSLLAFDGVSTWSLAGLYSDTEHPWSSPTPTAADCAGLPPTAPTLPADAVMYYAKVLPCKVNDWNVQVPAWHAAATSTLNTSIDAVKASTETAWNNSQSRVDVFADQLIGAVSTTQNGTRMTKVEPTFTLIDEAQTTAQQAMDDILAAFGDSADGVVSDMTTQVDEAVTDSQAAREALSLKFDNLMTDLGNPDPVSRVGLLGKLRSIASQVGDTADVMAALARTTTEYGNDRSADVREINLRAAQFVAAEGRLGGFPPFAGAPQEVPVTTLFTFRIGA